MDDETTRLAARLARQEGQTHPLAWVQLWLNHTPYEWAVQVALCGVEPWGDERADIREARNAAHLIAAIRRDMPLSDDEFRELQRGLARYLKCDPELEEVLGPQAMRQALGDG